MIFVSLTLAASPVRADESVLDALGKATGLISPPADPPDFVKASRPSQEPESIPAFASPEEPRSKVKSPAELRAMDADLERASRRRGARASGSDDSDAAQKQRRSGKSKRIPSAQP